MRRAARFLLTVLLTTNAAVAGLATKAGNIAVPRHRATATLLTDGRVLIAGGNDSETRVEIFDPRTGLSTLTAEITQLPLLGHTATLLRDGRILIAGGGYLTDGRPAFGNYGSTTADAYAPESLLPVGRMNRFRMNHTATLLTDGRVLITGGENVNVGGFHLYRDVTDSAEIFDPATNTFRMIVASMHEKRASHTATLLANGRVLLIGGTSVEIFDPIRETFAVVATLTNPRIDHTATLLPDGRVLLVGGLDIDGPAAEIYDPATNTFTEVTADIGNRRGHKATLLANGNVLISGGTPEAVVLDPNTLEITDRFTFDIVRHAATLLEDGSVLLVAGRKDVDVTDVVRYRPAPYKTRRRAVR